MKYYSYINTAVTILGLYKGAEPFSIFSKEFFRANKKYGSKDRKLISHLCYCYFRLGKAFPGMVSPERVVLALFFCSNESSEILQQLQPGLNEQAGIELAAKFKLTDISLTSSEIFPWEKELSWGIDYLLFCYSFFIQPDLFLRVRPGFEQQIIKQLENAGIAYRLSSPSCIALANNSKLEEIVAIDKEVVIQDRNSQRVGELLQLVSGSWPLAVWDCCAASGGKSIMAYDLLPEIALTVSDIRESILVNLRKRFTQAGIRNYRSLRVDLSRAVQMEQRFDLLIADVPCSGSGTWSRTPEQLYYFTETKIAEYAALQKQVVINALPWLKPGGFFLYITCSVFRQENEEQVSFIQQQFGLELVKQELLKGYEQKADTLFAALFRKPQG